jgi:hypothetical protein
MQYANSVNVGAQLFAAVGLGAYKRYFSPTTALGAIEGVV